MNRQSGSILGRSALGLGGAAALLIGATGCANAGEGLITGAGLGAAAGAVIGAFSGGAGSGAAIGAVTGAVAGSFIGDQNERARHNAYIASRGRERVVYVPERRYDDWDAERRRPVVFEWRVYEREHHHHHHHHYERCYYRHPY